MKKTILVLLFVLSGVTAHSQRKIATDKLQIKSLPNVGVLGTDAKGNLIESAGGGGATNLSSIMATDKVTVVSSTGSNADIPTATRTKAGLQKANFYEEGTFTPVLRSGLAITNTYTAKTTIANYIRVGNLVTIKIVFFYIKTPFTLNPNYIIKVVGLPFSTKIGWGTTINVPTYIEGNGTTNTYSEVVGTAFGDDILLQGIKQFGTMRPFQTGYEAKGWVRNVAFNGGVLMLTGTYMTNVYTP